MRIPKNIKYFRVVGNNSVKVFLKGTRPVVLRGKITQKKLDSLKDLKLKTLF